MIVFDALKMVVYQPDICCGIVGAWCLTKAFESNNKVGALQLFPPEETSLLNPMNNRGRLVSLRGRIQGQDISDSLIDDGVKKCFQNLTVTHHFNIEQVRRVEHVRPSGYQGVLNRTYTNETFQGRSSQTGTYSRVSALSLKLENVSIAIEKPKRETIIKGEESTRALADESDIKEAAYRLGGQENREDSIYFVSEEYLKINEFVTVAGILEIGNPEDPYRTARIKDVKLISAKRVTDIEGEKKEDRNCWVIAAGFFFWFAKRFHDNKKYKNETPGMWCRTFCFWK